MEESLDTTVIVPGNMSGHLLGGRYQKLESVGLGGMAEVFKGRDTFLKREVAIKVMLPKYTGDPSFALRFQTEAQAAAQLKSPYAVSVYDAGMDVGQYYIIMEFVHGMNLREFLAKNGKLSPSSVAFATYQVCTALAEAHALGIVHRDVKSSNIMITRGVNGASRAQIMDFGIAQATRFAGNVDKGMVMGTVNYMSPEQISGSKVTGSSDLYSLGIVAYEAVTGRLPFAGSGNDETMQRQLTEKPIPPQDLCPNVDDDLNDIIMKALEKKVEDRYSNASDMLQALNNYISTAHHPHREIAYPSYWAIGFVRGPQAICGTYRTFENSIVIGRSPDADVVLPDHSVSRKHLRLTPRGKYLEVQDLVSSNGTYVNGNLLSGSMLITAGANLDVGEVRIRIGKK